MKDENFKKGIENLKNISMTREEKDLILERIFKTKGRVRSFWVNPVFYNYAFATLVILLLVGGTASISAEKALPGDFLYPLKTSFNESLRTAITIDEVSQVEWEKEKIGRRLEEVEALSIQGKIDDKTSETIEKNIEANLETLDQTVEKAQKEDEKSDKRTNVQFKLQVQKEAHDKIIEKISENKTELQKAKIKTLNTSIKKKIEQKIEDLEKRKKK